MFLNTEKSLLQQLLGEMLSYGSLFSSCASVKLAHSIPLKLSFINKGCAQLPIQPILNNSLPIQVQLDLSFLLNNVLVTRQLTCLALQATNCHSPGLKFKKGIIINFQYFHLDKLYIKLTNIFI